MVEKRPRDLYDVVIIGGGPAGLAAAIYTARQGLTTAVVAGELGGQAQWASRIDNYLGLGLVSGSELAGHFRSHVQSFDIDSFPGQYADALVRCRGALRGPHADGTAAGWPRRDHRHRARPGASGRARREGAARARRQLLRHL